MIRIHVPKRYKPENRLEIAPLLDVIFILLIFFAVSSTIIMNKGIQLQLPAAISIEKEKRGAVLAIDAAQNVYLNQEKIPSNLVRTRIAEIIKTIPDTQVIIQADRRTPYEFLITVLDDIRMGGCYDLVLEAKKRADEHH